MNRTVLPVPSARTWTGLHCHLAWHAVDVDHFLVHRLRPLLDGLRMSGHLADWYFLRHQERGPHLRIPLRGADWCTVRALRTDLARLVAETGHPVLPGGVDHLPHGHVHEVPHRPRVERHGGVAALPYAEDAFCRSTELALTLLADPGAGRLTVATDAVLATALALGLDRRSTGTWLRTHPAWRTTPDAPLLPAVAASRSLDFDARRERLARARDHVRWTNAVRRARRGIEGDSTHPVAGVWLTVWGWQLHGLLNRIGLAPAEERTLCRQIGLAFEARDRRRPPQVEAPGSLPVAARAQ